MDKSIASELWMYCNSRRATEFRKWGAMSERERDEKKVEAQRQKVGGWAEAANLFYKVSIGEITYDKDFESGFCRATDA